MTFAKILGGGAALTFTVAILSIILVWSQMHVLKREFVARMQLLESQAVLQQTLIKIKDLKSKQNGDYFLTSLLIKPLNQNTIHNKNINIEFLISQKKKFQFKQ